VNARRTERFDKDIREAPARVQKDFEKHTLRHLLRDLRHPSLRAKKYDETRDIWQARVNRDWRFYFQIDGDTYVLLTIISHP
jgi:plasmid maintenance system killer protein